MCKHCGPLPEPAILLTRKPPWPSVAPEYQVCLGCARSIRQEQASRNDLKSTRTAPPNHARNVPASMLNVSPSRSDNAALAGSRELSAEGDLFTAEAE